MNALDNGSVFDILYLIVFAFACVVFAIVWAFNKVSSRREAKEIRLQGRLARRRMHAHFDEQRGREYVRRIRSGE